MQRTGGNSTGARAILVVLVVGVMGLAASPTALARDRGGPGQPGTQQAAPMPFCSLPPLKAPRLVSWSD